MLLTATGIWRACRRLAEAPPSLHVAKAAGVSLVRCRRHDSGASGSKDCGALERLRDQDWRPHRSSGCVDGRPR